MDLLIKKSMIRKLVKGVLVFLPFYLFTFLLFTSCSESSDEVDEFPDWQATNATKWNSIYAQATERIAAGDTSWKIIKSWNLEDSLHSDNTSYIVVHVIKAGTGSGSPLYTDYVRVNYKGTLLPSTSYPNGYEFDSSWHKSTSDSTAAPAQFLVSGLTDGFATAVQHMHIGDEWVIYVPWTLGYGATASGSIPAYSVLTFDLELVSYYRGGSTVPDFSAKGNNQWITE